MEARELMLYSRSGCYPMISSPLISPRLWESRLTQLKVWRPSRPSGRCTCEGHLWRWWVVYAPNFSGSTTWLCEPLLARLFPCHSCAFHTKQGFTSMAAWTSRSPKRLLRSSSSRRGMSQVTYVTIVPRGNETLRRRAIPTRALLHSWKLMPAARHVLLSILVMTSPAPDVWPSILTDYTYDLELDNADGVPHSVYDAASRSLGEPWLHM